MLITEVVFNELRRQGYEPTLIDDRSLSTYSWQELISSHPEALRVAAGSISAEYCTSLQDFDTRYTPVLGMHQDEDANDYDRRIATYTEHGFFPAKIGSSLAGDPGKTPVIVCHDPFNEGLDTFAQSPLVIVPRSLVDGILRDTRSSRQDIAPYDEQEPIEAWINKLLLAAYNMGAADIEITSFPYAMRVRVHVLNEWTSWRGGIPLTKRSLLLRALCAAANKDYEPGVDIDFKLERRINGIDTSWRGAITPAALGDSVTLRIMPSIGRVPSLEELGFCARAQELLRKAKKRHDGLVLVTGPTGQGKTTTLYSLIVEMRDEGRKIFTAEQPVELVIPGTVQKPVNDAEEIDPKYRVSFASAIRAALRHKPDVLVVGETRDGETAQAGVSMSRTGHLTFTTLHTTNIRTSVKRMMDLGIDAINLADTLILVASQHLVRILCPHCKIEHDNGEATRSLRGCPSCKGLGATGKSVIYEIAYLDDQAREAIINGSVADEFPRLAAAGLYISKRDSGMALVQRGQVDRIELEELVDVV